MSTPDDIRRKRLERMGNAPPTQAPASPPPPSAPAAPPPSPPKAVARDDSPKRAAVASPVVIPIDAKASPAPNPTLIHDILSRVFAVTLQESQGSRQCLFLDALYEELRAEYGKDEVARALTNDRATVDRVVVARLGLYGQGVRAFAAPNDDRHFDFLLAAYTRAMEEERGLFAMRNVADREQATALLGACRSIIASYMRLVLTMPDIFPQSAAAVQAGADLLTERLLSSSGDGEIPSLLLSDLAAPDTPPDEVASVFTPVLRGLTNHVRQLTAMDDLATPAVALGRLVAVRPIAAVFVNMPSFLPNATTPREFELQADLAQFLRPAVIDEQSRVARELLINKSDAEAATALRTLHGTLGDYFKLLHEAVASLLRPIETRDRVLQFFATLASLNRGRARMHVDPRTVGSDGVVLGALAILFRLCEPIMAPTSPMRAQIDKAYYMRQRRFDASNETRLNAAKEDIEEAARQAESAGEAYKANFITECFFLTAAFVHIGIIGCQGMERENARVLREIQQVIDTIQQRMQQLPPQQAEYAQAELTRMRTHADRIRVQRLGAQMHIFSPSFFDHACRFAMLSASWLSEWVLPSGTALPLRGNAPIAFRVLPEYLVEDMSEIVLLVLRTRTQMIQSLPIADFVRFAVVFMASPDYIKNPYMRAKLVDVLVHFTPYVYENERAPPEVLGYLLDVGDAQRFLASALMRLYCEVENTGAAHAFYDKFPIRHNIASIIKYIWTSSEHQNTIIELSKDATVFIPFINHLRGDMTFLLDEGLSQLAEIHNLEEKLKDEAAFGALPQNEQEEIRKNLRNAERMATSYMQLGNETVNMLRFMTESITAPFLSAEVVDLFIAMLDFNVKQLVGPKCTDLKVSHPEKYFFRPRQLLTNILDVFIHLRSPGLVRAMANDTRSYSKQIFSIAIGILRNYGLREEDDIKALSALVAEVEEAVQQGQEEELDLADAPEDFFDPLMATLMREPVRLPTSNMVVDLATIKSQLLSKPQDPFNRQPLTVDMVVPETELKERINAYVAAKRAARKANEMMP